MKCENPVIYKKVGNKISEIQLNKSKKINKVVNDLKYIGHLSDFVFNGFDKNFDDPTWCKINNYVVVPCQRCISCRLNYSKSWADRLILASENVKYKYFITLTYDEEFIKTTETKMYNMNDELVVGHSLVKDHIQKFMKRLRKFANKNKLIDGQNIQYYLCGEYGDINGRPHYHIILFNFIIDDLELEYCKNNFEYYQSKIIDKLWNMGRTQVCNVSYETCAYVSGYVTKKVYGQKAADEYVNRAVVPEFCTMSRRPAIGKDLYDEKKYDIYKSDSLLLKRGDNVYDIKPVRYYDKLFDIDEPTLMSDVKLARSFHKTYYHTDKYGYEYLQTKVKNLKAKQKIKKGEL